MEAKILDEDSLGKRDYMLAAGTGLAFMLVYFVFAARGMDPALWGDLSASAGITPPRTIFPGIWRTLACGLLALFGKGGVTVALRVVGSVLGGLSVFFCYLIIRETLAYLARARDIVAWRRIASTFTLLATVSIGAGDAMMRVVSPVTPGGLRFLALVVATHIFLRYLKAFGLWRILISMAIAGAIASESPFGFLLPAVYYLCYRLSLIAVVNDQLTPDEDAVKVKEDETAVNVFILPKWRMFFSFLGGLFLFGGINIFTFIKLGGFEASGWNGFDLAIHYAIGYYEMILASASAIGWVLSVTFALLPLIACLVLFPMLCRDTEPIPFKSGLIMFFAGVLALLQCGVFPYTRLWTFSSAAVELRSDFIVCVFMLFSAMTLALASSCFALGCQKKFIFDEDDGVFRAFEPQKYVMRRLVQVIVVLGLLPAVFRISRPAETEMRSIVHDALAETVRECGDAKFLFTDGRLDAGLELVAAQMGSDVKPLNMMSGASEWEKYVRTRHFDVDSADYTSAEIGVPILLRIWAGEVTNGMDNAAAQLGFEFWRRARKPIPPISGLVARTKGIDEAESRRGATAAKQLAARILRIAKNHGGVSVSPALRDAVSSVSWRISRFSRMRDEDELANELDEWNDTVKQMMRVVEYERIRTFMQLTPYEGLRLALRRADFAEARRYAKTVLQMDPDDPEANFGTGMAYLMEDKLKEAEMYLENTLKKRPDEPAVLNNLSIIYRKTNRLEKALEYVKKAHELMPANEEILRTLRDTERVVENRKNTLRSAFGR